VLKDLYLMIRINVLKEIQIVYCLILKIFVFSVFMDIVDNKRMVSLNV